MCATELHNKWIFLKVSCGLPDRVAGRRATGCAGSARRQPRRPIADLRRYGDVGTRSRPVKPRWIELTDFAGAQKCERPPPLRRESSASCSTWLSAEGRSSAGSADGWPSTTRGPPIRTHRTCLVLMILLGSTRRACEKRASNRARKRSSPTAPIGAF